MIEIIIFLLPAIFATSIFDFFTKQKSSPFTFLKKSLLFMLAINLFVWLSMIIVFDSDILQVQLDNYHSMFFSLSYLVTALVYAFILSFLSFIFKTYVKTFLVYKKNKK